MGFEVWPQGLDRIIAIGILRSNLLTCDLSGLIAGQAIALPLTVNASANVIDKLSDMKILDKLSQSHRGDAVDCDNCDAQFVSAMCKHCPALTVSFKTFAQVDCGIIVVFIKNLKINDKDRDPGGSRGRSPHEKKADRGLGDAVPQEGHKNHD